MNRKTLNIILLFILSVVTLLSFKDWSPSKLSSVEKPTLVRSAAGL